MTDRASDCGQNIPTMSGPTTSSRIAPEFTRECLAIRVNRKLKSTDVIDVLSDLFILRGTPIMGRVKSRPT